MKQRTANSLFALVSGILAGVCLIMFVDEAGATGYKKPEQRQDQSQKQDQHQEQDQNQDQSQDQSVEVTTSTGDQSNQQVVNFTSPDDITIRNTASANPPNVSSSHACALGGSIGIGIPGGNIGGGKQKVDPECVRREESRLLNALGERELAVIHLCNSPTLVESLGDACGPSVTQEELRRRIDFLLEERAQDRAKCEESKDRITEACRK